jgi:predicted DCC family thiol-disulfide oxidoreductase YuxK
MMAEKHWLLWDGDCGLCRRTASWVKRHDNHERFRIVPYQEAPSPPMSPGLHAACGRAMHIVKSDGTVLRAGRASLFILELIGWGWVARLLTLPPFIWIVELGYRIVARNRPFFARFLFIND